MPKKAIDMTGQRFGRLVAVKQIDKADIGKENGIYWLCKCDCGNEVVVASQSLKRGQTKSCGCLRKEKKEIIDLTGQRFEKLTVIRQEGRNENGEMYWLCQCDCGNTTVVKGYYLKSGRIKSCGCMRTFEKANKARQAKKYEKIWGGNMPEVQNAVEIKECPFCGKPANLTTLFYDKSRWTVQCSTCNVRTDFYDTPLAAVTTWNKRFKK